MAKQDGIRKVKRKTAGNSGIAPLKLKYRQENQVDDYILFLDADEYFVIENNFQYPTIMNLDYYYVKTHYYNLHYNRIQFIGTKLDWKWYGVVHEVVDCAQAKTVEELKHIYVHVTSEGNSWTDNRKYHKHAELLEKAIADGDESTRNIFYLAQSYRDAQENERSILNYQKRAKMGGWHEEIYYSLLQVGKLQQQIGISPRIFMQSYIDAFRFRRSRIESLYFLGKYYNDIGHYETAFNLMSRVILFPSSHDALFVDNWIYEEGRWFEFFRAV